MTRTLNITDRSGHAVVGPYADLWRMLFTYSGVWRSGDRPEWYVSFPDDLCMFRKIVSEERYMTMSRRRDRHYRIARLAALLCCHGKCRCGGGAIDVVGEEMLEMRPVCAVCFQKAKWEKVKR